MEKPEIGQVRSRLKPLSLHGMKGSDNILDDQDLDFSRGLPLPKMITEKWNGMKWEEIDIDYTGEAQGMRGEKSGADD